MMETNKYIIEIPDNTAWLQWVKVADKDGHVYFDFKDPEDLTPYIEPDLDAVCKEAYQQGYEQGYKDGYNEPGKNQQETYQRGMDDANRDGEYNADDGWYVMQKISLLPNPIKTELFGTAETAVILQDNSFKDALAKLTEYEQEQEEQIQVGDEVEAAFGKATITETTEKHVYYFYADGSYGFDEKERVTKTGRHFPEIAEVLKKMQEEKE